MRAHKYLTSVTVASLITALAAAAAPATAASPGGPGPGQPAAPAGPAAPGIVTGLVRGPGGAPLAGVCVTASGPAGRASAVTPSDGRFVLSGLRTGPYTLQYRVCAHPAAHLVPQGQASALVTAGVTLPRTAQLPGGAGLPGPAGAPGTGSSRIMITGGQVTRLAPVIMRPPHQAGAIRPVAPRRLTSARPHGRAAGAREGGMTGRVTDAAGHPVPGVCVWARYRTFAQGISTGKDGSYHARFLLPGQVTVAFTASCDTSSPPPGNWAPEWYKQRFSLAKADPVTIRAGHTTKGINAVMRHGGKIAGVVTNGSGSRLTGVCVDVLSNDATTFVAQVRTTRGRYLVDSLDPGRYRVLFDPACGYRKTPYLLQWWRGAATLRASKPVRARFATVTGNIDAKLALGGKITGVIRLKNRRGRPLRGICVDATGQGAASSVDIFTATGRTGRYVIEGLPTGSYSLFAGPGCGANPNVLYENYPHPIAVTAGQAKVINLYLQPGGILSGTVASAADGSPLGGICVGIGRLGDFTITRSDGSYTLDQLPSGHYAVVFVGGCGSAGSYAPQWYKNRDKFFRAASVAITEGQVTSGIDAAMKPGVTITGTVLNRSGHKVSDVCVGALDPGTAAALGNLGNTLSRNGGYRIANLAAGQYQVVFFWCGVGPGYTTQWFSARRDNTTAGLLDVDRAATVTGIDAVLRPAGGIAGTITDAAGNPVEFACISAINAKPGGVSAIDQFTFGGGYEIAGLPPGRYDVQFTDCGGLGFASQWYPGKTSRRAASPVTVTARRFAKPIDAALATKAGSITGRVTARATGRPVAGICVFAYNQNSFDYSITTATGRYAVKGLNSGRYRVLFSGCRRDETYADVTRTGFVQVISPKTATGINEALVPGASISGTVLGGQGSPVGQPAVCIDVVAAAGGAIVAFGETGHGGRYTVSNLAAGSYQVFFGDPACSGGAQGLVPQWYDGKHTRIAAATVVVTQGQARTGVDATLAADGTITGTVTGPAPASTPLAGVCVIARPLRGPKPIYAVSHGGYSLTDVPPGRYVVEFVAGCGASGLAPQWWHDSLSRAGATVITVTAGQTTTRIDARMRK
jgi:hypothetical protein